MDVDLIYLSMMGELVQPLDGIPNAFATGQPCHMLYQKIYAARCRLCDRLGVEEDADLESILDCFLRSIGSFVYGCITSAQNMPCGTCDRQFPFPHQQTQTPVGIADGRLSYSSFSPRNRSS